MNITWYGQTCFQLEDQSSISIVTDPYSPEVRDLPDLRADVVTVSYDDISCNYSAAVDGEFKLFDGPGEYEVSGVFITGIATFADEREEGLRGVNTVFAFDFDGLTVCHLGRLGYTPAQSQVKDLGTVDVLLVPVGGGGSLTPPQASKVVTLFEPSIVIPMLYEVPGLRSDLGAVDSFLREMGVDDVEEVDGRESLNVSDSDLSGEMQIIVLEAHVRPR